MNTYKIVEPGNQNKILAELKATDEYDAIIRANLVNDYQITVVDNKPGLITIDVQKK